MENVRQEFRWGQACPFEWQCSPGEMFIFIIAPGPGGIVSVYPGLLSKLLASGWFCKPEQGWGPVFVKGGLTVHLTLTNKYVFFVFTLYCIYFQIYLHINPVVL